MPRCPECQVSIAAHQAACHRCGFRLDIAAERCTRCGEQVAADADACPACGILRQDAPCDRHPDRAARGQCVICGTRLCDECNRSPGGAFLCWRHAFVPVMEGWAQVYTTGDDIEAELIRENLLAEGVDARVLSQKDHFSFTVDIGNLSPVRVLVPAFAYDDALEVIRDHMDPQGDVHFACPVCGETYQAGEGNCSNCGAPVP